jgi:serine/threonine protein kinase
MSDLIGQTLAGRFLVEAFVGRGGMAEVYKVWDQRRATYLAMKVLREDLAEDKIFLRRFRREAQTLSRLQHPHIVRYYGLEQEGLLAFILMDFITGSSLRREIFETTQPLSSKRTIEIMRPVCAALHYAHSLGYVHCDVKPGNILIEHTGRILVSDFGIARLSKSATSTMIGIGTPAYMAPEQIRGKDPTVQTDIYSLGIVLFEMLTGGERPFTGEQAKITGITHEKIRWEQINLAPPNPRRFNPRLNHNTEKVILKCLEKKPENRFGEVLEFLGALEKAEAKTRIVEGVPHPIKKPHTQHDRQITPQIPPAKLRIASRPTRKFWSILGLSFILLTLIVSGIFLIKPGIDRSLSQRSTLSSNALTSHPIAIQENSRRNNLVFTSNRDGKREVYYMDTRGKVSRITFTPGDAESWEPILTPSGQIVFTSNRDGKREIYYMDTKGEVTRITSTYDNAESWGSFY